MNGHFLRAAIVIGGISAVMFATLFIKPSYGHDHDRPELNAWFDKLASGKGLCCTVTDGVAIPDVDWATKDGHYRVRIEDQWFAVDDDAVITEPNKDGRTMVWPYYADGKVLFIRCFMPGSMT